MSTLVTSSTAVSLPWHGVGTPYDGESPDEFMQKCHLDWTVEKRRLYYLDNNGDLRESSKLSLIRTDNNNELSTVSTDWEEAQNDLLKDFVFKFAETKSEKKIIPHSAGELDGGKIVWITAFVDEHTDLFKGKDRIDSYLLFIITHMYGKAISISYLPSIMRCSNVIRKMLGSRTKQDLSYRISHRNVFDPDIAFRTLGLASKSMEEYAIMAEYLGSKTYTKETLEQFLMQVYPSQSQEERVLSKPAQKILSIIHTMPNADVGRGTWWAALNAVTYYANHVYGKRQEVRWKSLIQGQSLAKNSMAVELAQQYAEMA